MGPQKEILQLLFTDQLYAKSDNKLAALLGYVNNSRSTIIRIKRGKNAKENTITEAWEKLKECFCITDEDIIRAGNSVAYGHNLLEELQAVYGIGNEWHEQAFKALAAGEYADISPEFDSKLSVSLNEMKLQDSAVYYGMLAYCYILCKNITPYTNKGKKRLHSQVDEASRMLYSLFPTNVRAKIMADKIISFDLAYHDDITQIRLLDCMRLIFANYIDEEFFEGFLRENGELLDVDDDSFWTMPGETFGKGCELWYFSVVPTKSHQHGSYMVLKLRAKSDAKDSFEMIESYSLMLMIIKDKDRTQIAQIYDLLTGNVDFACFGYDYDAKLLEFYFDIPEENLFGLPDVLQCLDIKNPQDTDGKVWANVIKGIKHEQRRKLLLQAINSSEENEYEFLDEYEIENVTIDRKNITIDVVHEGAKNAYTMPVDSYPFIENLIPAETVSVSRSKSSGEMFFTWNNLGQFVPMNEFKSNS